MTDEERLTNGERAARALDAIAAYSSPGPASSPELIFLTDSGRNALPGGDQDRMTGLLTGLMHYAERRDLSFQGALNAARQEYERQRTTYLPGNAVRQAGPHWRTPAPGERSLNGEVLRALPGTPAEYEVDFITDRVWLPETSLEPAAPFPAVTTSKGTFSSAHIAWRRTESAVYEIERNYQERRAPDASHASDLSVLLTALSAWTGLRRSSLLASLSNIITEREGQLVAGAAGQHPVTLAAASAPASPAASLGPPPDSGTPGAAVLPFRKRERRRRAERTP